MEQSTRKRTSTKRITLIATITGIVVVTFAAQFIYTSHVQKKAFENSVRLRLLQSSEMIRESLIVMMSVGDQDSVNNMIVQIGELADVAMLALTGPDGAVISSNDKKLIDTTLYARELNQTRNAGAPQYYSIRENDESYELGVIPVNDSKDCQSCHDAAQYRGFIIMKTSTQKDLSAIHRQQAISSAFMSGILVILVVSLIAVIMLMVVRPLANLVRQLRGNATEFTAVSRQVFTASQSLAQGASEQAASAQEISSSLEQMAAMTKKNAMNAQQAEIIAQEAHQASIKGNTAAGTMLEAMGKISESAQQTQKIIRTIDDIAFQTNLLALNAAVEAARAGEAGKGFAVVAEEVRNLARRSADASRNTTDLIEDSVTRTQEGAQIATAMTEALQGITNSATKVTALVAEIAASSKEQAQGIDQINNSVGKMDKVTQSSAANAEQCASASMEMSTQAEHLQEIIDELSRMVSSEAKVSDSMAQHEGLSAPRQEPVNRTAARGGQHPLSGNGQADQRWIERPTAELSRKPASFSMSIMDEMDTFEEF